MNHLHLLLLLVTVPDWARSETEARAIVQQAIAAVEVDGVDLVEHKWRRALASDSSDRAALLGIATLARLTIRTTENHLANLRICLVSPRLADFVRSISNVNV